MQENNHIADPTARSFVAALRSFEQDGDLSGLVEHFADGATLTRLDARGARTDPRAFWREYRDQFEQVSTTFRNAVESRDQVALEWDSKAVLRHGTPVTYSGVTVLDLDAGSIVGLRTYYDTAAFTPGPAPDRR